MKLTKKIRGIGFLLGLFLTASTASASLLVEPHIGYNVSGTGDQTVGAATVDYDYKGPQYGLRAGYKNLGFMAGLDFTHSSGDLESEVSAGGVTVTTKSDFTRNEVGVFAGFNFPILVRGWAAYYFSNKIDFGTNKYEGNTIELGAGFTALPFLSINLVYRMVTYDENTSVNATTTNEIKLTEIVLGVSLPLTL